MKYIDKFIIKWSIRSFDQLKFTLLAKMKKLSFHLTDRTPSSQVMTFLIYKLVANLIVFAPWGASCRESVQEAELEVFGRAFKYVSSKNIMDAIF